MVMGLAHSRWARADDGFEWWHSWWQGGRTTRAVEGVPGVQGQIGSLASHAGEGIAKVVSFLTKDIL